MSKVKEYKENLTNKEILQAFVQTLSDKNCKEAYQILRERYDRSKVRMLRLNEDGEVDDKGLVRLRPKELERLLATCGEYKAYWLIKKLHRYLVDLKERASIERGEARSRWKKYQKISHYLRLTKGWVAQCYDEEVKPQIRTVQEIDFYSIQCEEEAEKYLSTIPAHLWAGNPEVEWLLTQYPNLTKGERNEKDK